ncbi:MAG: HD domain-containing protein [Desulfobacterales bacterium]|nr:HD domain-containing protein [Desulfobacterales bacterium]
MNHIADLLFQAKILKEIPRSGYHFLGSGQESIAEHTFMISIIAFVMAKLNPGINALKLISMCLVHDLPESRTGDLNTVQKQYVKANESQAVADTIKNLPFGGDIADLIDEFNAGQTEEAKLAKDADQLAFIVDLKALADVGYAPPNKWLDFVVKRLQTNTGKDIAHGIMNTDWDSWWLKNYVDRK